LALLLEKRRAVAMEFRWVAFITLWTMLIGPIMDMSVGSSRANPNRAPARLQSKVVPGR
jgi:hypothetical protein